MEHDSLDELLKDNRIMDDEWLALGRALNIDNILTETLKSYGNFGRGSPGDTGWYSKRGIYKKGRSGG